MRDSTTATGAVSATGERSGDGAERVLLLSARTVAELDAQLAAVVDGRDPGGSEVRPRGQQVRLGLVNPTVQRVRFARKIVAKGTPWRGRRDLWFTPEPLLRDGGIAWVFPGLEADVTPRVDDVAALLGTASPELSTSTLGRHAAGVFAVNRVMGSALGMLGLRPDALAGHSVGEWSAMMAGGILDTGDFDAMIARADLDALQVPGIEFAVLGCGLDRAEQAITCHPDVVVSHENATNQTVVCGPTSQVEALTEQLRAGGVICQLLPFRSGFHTPMLKPYLTPFTTAGVPSLPMRTASVPVWSATTARPFPAEPTRIRELCVRHLVEPVRFRALTLAMYDAGMRVFIQAGPGQLGSLIDDTLREREHVTVAANSAHRTGIAQLRRVATAVWVEGGDVDFGALDQRSPPAVPAPRRRQPVEDSARARLRDLAAHSPLAAAFNAALEKAADSVNTVLAEAEKSHTLRAPRAPLPRRAPRAQRTRAAAQPAPPRVDVLEVSISAMPYLLDHCMAEQRPGWPEDADRRPVVPATTMVAHMMDAALAAEPGAVVTEVSNIRFRRWLVAAPATRVEVEVHPDGPGSVRVRLGDYAESRVLFGAGYPQDRPEPWQRLPVEQPPAVSARELYAERWMFHGPRFQGVSASVGISATGFRGEITVDVAPGFLLDNVGHLIGQWLVERQPERCIAFPAEIERIRFHQALPQAGDVVDAEVRIIAHTADAITVDGQVRDEGGVVASISGWRDYLVDSDARICAVHRHVARSTLAQRQTGGWWACWRFWQSLASREFFMHKYLGAAERADYQELPPQQRSAWLLGRVAIKDAVRGWLAERGSREVYPAEIQVWQDAFDSYRATGMHGLELPALTIAFAQRGDLAVARVHQPVDSGAVDARAAAVVEIADVFEASLRVSNSVDSAEEELLDRLRAETSDALPTALARLVTAREGAVRVAGGGGTASLRDVRGSQMTVLVEAPERVHRVVVDTLDLRSPEGLPAQHYVVAGQAQAHERHRQEAQS